MIQLNKDIHVGLELDITENLPHRLINSMFIGTFIVTDCLPCRDIILTRTSDKATVYTDFETVSYLSGKHIEAAKRWVLFNNHQFQPDVNDAYDCTYFTEDTNKWIDWKCDRHRDSYILHCSLLQSFWCYT